MKKAWTGGIRGVSRVLETDEPIRPTHRLPVYVNVAMKQIDLFGVYNCCPSGDNLFVDPPASQQLPGLYPCCVPSLMRPIN